MDVLCNLTAEQAALYQAVVDEMLARIETSRGDRAARPGAGHDDQAQAGLQPPGALPARRQPAGRALGQAGAARRDPATRCWRSGEKALLFTQYAEFGALLRGHLAGRFGREVLFLHGGVAKPARDEMVARFQADDGPRRRCSCSPSRPAAPG